MSIPGKEARQPPREKGSTAEEDDGACPSVLRAVGKYPPDCHRGLWSAIRAYRTEIWLIVYHGCFSQRKVSVFSWKGEIFLRITDLRIGRLSLPLAHPFKTALRTVERIEDVAVMVVGEDGGVGYGEAPPTAVITGDTTGSILCAIEDYIRPAIVGMELDDLSAVMEKLNACLVHNTSPKAAVDMALYDLWAKSQGKPLYQLLGNARSSFETDLTISVNQVDEMVKDALEAVRRGFTTLKIKVGKEGLADIDRVTSIRKAVGNDIQLRVDANQGWTAAQSVAIIKTMEARGLNIQLVEQPVPADDIAGLKYVSGQVDTPILADEAVFSPTDAANLIAIRACDYINIKLMKTGGIWNALKICELAKQHGMECMIGCMLESQVAVSAAAHLCGGQGAITMADLDGPSLCASEPFPGGPVFDGPTIRLNDTPGIGIELPGEIFG